MSLFSTRYIFVHNDVRSKEFYSARTCIYKGADKVDRPWATHYTVALEGNIGRPRTFKEAKRRALNLLKFKPIGTAVRIDSWKGEDKIDSVRFRKLLIGPPVKDTRGPVGLDRVEGYIESAYRNARFAGDCVCKPNSDHADCAAVDYFDSSSNMLKMLADIRTNPTYFNLKYAILFDRIYFPDGTSRDYTGQYHWHIHVSVTGGTPGAAC